VELSAINTDLDVTAERVQFCETAASA
jgi:hypothetical protein